MQCHFGAHVIKCSSGGSKRHFPYLCMGPGQGQTIGGSRKQLTLETLRVPTQPWELQCPIECLRLHSQESYAILQAQQLSAINQKLEGHIHKPMWDHHPQI